jgi:hypothetical protein
MKLCDKIEEKQWFVLFQASWKSTTEKRGEEREIIYYILLKKNARSKRFIEIFGGQKLDANGEIRDLDFYNGGR